MPLPKKPETIRTVYLDNAATTPVDSRVLLAMQPFFAEQFHNPSALYRGGLRAREAVEAARQGCAKALSTEPDTIYFTSGGTESCNLAILGSARAHTQRTGRVGHILTTAVEHPAVLHACHFLEQEGWRVTFIPVDAHGKVTPETVAQSVEADTALVSIMYANNEIGSIQPIADIGRALLKYRKANGTLFPLFHTDACQATPELLLDVEKLHVDLLSVNGSKIYGPKGAGLLYKRRDVPCTPSTHGGGQERGLRSGTENVPEIVGLGAALSLVRQDLAHHRQHTAELRDTLWEGISRSIPRVHLNGPPTGADRLANNLHVHFDGVDEEALLFYLDEYGIQVGIGSACSSQEKHSSHVMQAIGQRTDGNIRFTLGRQTSEDDIAYVLRYLPPIVDAVRTMRSERL